jgi:hypothetical protein
MARTVAFIFAIELPPETPPELVARFDAAAKELGSTWDGESATPNSPTFDESHMADVVQRLEEFVSIVRRARACGDDESET